MLKMPFALPVGLAVLCISFGTVEVAAQTDVTVAIVPRTAAGVDDFATTLPTADTTFPLGGMVVEVWAQTMAPAGFAQVSLDFSFPQNAFAVTSLTHTSTFSLFPQGTIDNANGLIDDLSGSVPPVAACGGAVGTAPQWARVAIIDLQASAGGSKNFVVGPTNNAVFVNANCGSLSPPAVTFVGATVTIDSPGVTTPAASSWGLLAMAMLLLSLGTARIQRNRSLQFLG